MSVCHKKMKILVPMDGSEHSERALGTAICLAQQFEGTLTLLHVAPSAIVTTHIHGVDVVGPEYTAIEHSLRKAGSKILAKGEKRAKTDGIPVKTLLREGHVVDEILQSCREKECDLIVMGARGLSRIKELFLGSVSDGVTRHSKLPVLIVK